MTSGGKNGGDKNGGRATPDGVRRIHLDAVGGVAGDMFVAALLDAFPGLAPRVLADARAVLPEGVGAPLLAEGMSGGVRALRFGLAGGAATGGRTEAAVHAHGRHDHKHRDHPHHGHDHQRAATAPPPGGATGATGASEDVKPAMDMPSDAGTYLDMRARIERAALHAGTAAHAAAILGLLAEAEADIHRVPVEEVHFHEIADWDSLLDVVAAGSLAAALEGVAWSVSDLPLGGGLVKMAHGLLPVPAPATAALLRGFGWRDDGIAGERVTPTGAAILKHLAPAARPAGGRLVAAGTGAGTRTLPGMANVLRALVFEEAPGEGDVVAVIECEIDDMTGEEIGTATEMLRAEPGVLDVSFGPRFGKKGRPVVALRLLVRPGQAEAAARACFAQTSTIGLRLREERRMILPRAAGEAGGVAVKKVARPGGATVKAESDALTGATLAERRALRRRAERDDG